MVPCRSARTPAISEAHDGADVQDQEQGEAGVQAVAGGGHELRQPGVQAVDQQQPHEGRHGHAGCDQRVGLPAQIPEAGAFFRCRAAAAGAARADRVPAGGGRGLGGRGDVVTGGRVSGSLNHRNGTRARPARPPTTNMVRQLGIDHEGKERRGHGADVVTGHGPGGGLSGRSGRCVVVHVGQRGGQAGAQAEAGEQPECAEPGHVGCEDDGDRKEGEPRHAGHQQVPPAEAVRERGDEERAEPHAHQGDGRRERRPNGVEAKFLRLDEGRDDRAEHHQVEAVQHHGQPAEPHGPP